LPVARSKEVARRSPWRRASGRPGPGDVLTGGLSGVNACSRDRWACRHIRRRRWRHFPSSWPIAVTAERPGKALAGSGFHPSMDSRDRFDHLVAGLRVVHRVGRSTLGRGCAPPGWREPGRRVGFRAPTAEARPRPRPPSMVTPQARSFPSASSGYASSGSLQGSILPPLSAWERGRG